MIFILSSLQISKVATQVSLLNLEKQEPNLLLVL